MAYRRADVEETALYAKKFVRYEEGAKKYSMGLLMVLWQRFPRNLTRLQESDMHLQETSREYSWITWLSIRFIIIGGRSLQYFLEQAAESASV